GRLLGGLLRGRLLGGSLGGGGLLSAAPGLVVAAAGEQDEAAHRDEDQREQKDEQAAEPPEAGDEALLRRLAGTGRGGPRRAGILRGGAGAVARRGLLAIAGRGRLAVALVRGLLAVSGGRGLAVPRRGLQAVSGGRGLLAVALPGVLLAVPGRGGLAVALLRRLLGAPGGDLPVLGSGLLSLCVLCRGVLAGLRGGGSGCCGTTDSSAPESGAAERCPADSRGTCAGVHGLLRTGGVSGHAGVTGRRCGLVRGLLGKVRLEDRSRVRPSGPARGQLGVRVGLLRRSGGLRLGGRTVRVHRAVLTGEGGSGVGRECLSRGALRSGSADGARRILRR